MITVRADMPTRAGNITLTYEPTTRHTLVYREYNSCVPDRERTWVFFDDALAMEILDLGDVSPEIIARLGEPQQDTP